MRDSTLDKHRQGVVSEVCGLVLEIGFGSGQNLPYYKNVTKLYAVDPSKELYDLALEKIKTVSFPVEFFQVSAENLTFEESSIDCILSTWTLCSIPHPEMALREVFRVLKPGGKFVFIEHGQFPKPFISKIQNILTPISKKFMGGCHLNRNIEKMILDSNFKIQKLEKFSHQSTPLSFMYEGVAIAEK